MVCWIKRSCWFFKFLISILQRKSYQKSAKSVFLHLLSGKDTHARRHRSVNSGVASPVQSWSSSRAAHNAPSLTRAIPAPPSCIWESTPLRRSGRNGAANGQGGARRLVEDCLTWTAAPPAAVHTSRGMKNLPPPLMRGAAPPPLAHLIAPRARDLSDTNL